MAQALIANDLLPLIAKLSHDEQVRLAQLALHIARDATRDAAVSPANPVRPDELSGRGGCVLGGRRLAAPVRRGEIIGTRNQSQRRRASVRSRRPRYGDAGSA